LVQLGRLLAASGREQYDVADLPERFSEIEPSSSASMFPPEPVDGTAVRRHAWLVRHAKEFERLKLALQASQGNLSEAARRAGIPRYRARRLLAAEASLSER
jgi:transcriptional regulator of acetoin/glycerol metabolism